MQIYKSRRHNISANDIFLYFTNNIYNFQDGFLKAFIIILALLNLIVLLGQLWPEGSPPFATAVNVIVLCLNLIFLGYSLGKKKTGL
jgi:hypothetical protein